MVTAQYTVTGPSNTNNTGTVTESGTSFAAPLTAGFAARLMAAALTAGKDATAANIKKLVEYSAQDTIAPPQFEGYGTINTIPASAATTPQLPAALATAAAGTLPAR